jgi:DNA-binding response OmpR family regulator
MAPPIIFISALDEKSLLRLSQRPEAPQYFQKPFDSRALLAIVRQHIGVEAVSKAG